MNAAFIIRPATVLLAALALVVFILTTPASRAGDESPIQLSIVSPSPGQSLSGSVKWEVTANQGPPVKFIEFFIDDNLKWREWLVPYVYNGDGNLLDTRTLPDGTHQLKVVATDDRGRTKSLAFDVKVSNGSSTPLPQVSIPEPANGATVSGTIKWLANVSGPKPDRVEFLIDGTVKWTEWYAAYGYGGDAGLMDTTQLSNGAHALKNVAYAADGRSTSASVTITVANASPTPTPTSPTPTASSSPTSTAPPTVSGTPVVGNALSSTLGSWTGTDPITYTRQWERCNTSGCTPISGATAASYTVPSADVGYSLRVTVKATNTVGSATASSQRTSTASTAPSTTSSTRSFTGWDPSLRPAFTPRRTITVTTRAAFDSAWANLQAGDKLVVSGVTFNGQVNLWNRMLADWAEVHFADDVRFVGGGAHAYPAVSVADVSKVRLYGGDVTNRTGSGIRLEDANDITWWGFRVHDTAGTGVFAFGITKPADRLDMRGEVWNCGWDLSLDPHAEPGTGNHAVYLSGNGYRTSGTFIFKVHDQPAGAAVQVGPYLQDSTLEIDARRITFQATRQVAGNAVQWWGNGIRNVKVRYIYGEDLAGRVSETDGLYDGSNPAGAIAIEYGRSAGNIRLSPRYAPDAAVQCLDCQ
jgi:hypothetical protein